MAGARHHILPKFLLKGFSKEGDGKEPKTWVYQQPGKVFQASTNKVSVEKNFYGKEGELTADNNITSLEGSFGALLDELRTKESGSEVFEVINDTLPILVTHLSLRTKNLRDSLRTDIGFLLEKLVKEFLRDPQALKNFIFNDINLRSYIFAEIKKIPSFGEFSNDQKNAFLRDIENFMPWVLDSEGDFFRGFITELIKILKTSLPQGIKEGHIKALNKDPTATPRIADYSGFHWYVYKSATPIILGDFGCLFEIVGNKPYKTITFQEDNILKAILPISSDKILVGASLSNPPDIDFMHINLETARCCQENFFCSIAPPGMNDLLPFIATNSDLISKEELLEIVSDAIKF